MKLQSVFFVAVISSVCFTYAKSPVRYFCGRDLANTLAMLCPYNEASKRSQISIESVFGTNKDIYDIHQEPDKVSSLSGDKDVQWNELSDNSKPHKVNNPNESMGKLTEDSDMSNDNFSLMEDNDLRMQMLQGFRHKRGVISECCDQPCTIDELLTYC
ncbi:unnamed protein product [Diatraea saccharalis]|uniref:Insulin-like domain-containing protein n=1 Tax=Diatraea saccharalis TaxID=40085 RepID=A0A9N9RAK9_9NEOP|nr:unnamed protein product [Diatraea saccharalis]